MQFRFNDHLKIVSQSHLSVIYYQLSRLLDERVANKDILNKNFNKLVKYAITHSQQIELEPWLKLPWQS